MRPSDTLPSPRAVRTLTWAYVTAMVGVVVASAVELAAGSHPLGQALLAAPLALSIMALAIAPAWRRAALGDDPMRAFEYLDVAYLRELAIARYPIPPVREAIAMRGGAFAASALAKVVVFSTDPADFGPSPGSRLEDPLPSVFLRRGDARPLLERWRERKSARVSYDDLRAEWRAEPLLAALEPGAPIADTVTRLVARYQGEIARWDAVALCRRVQREKATAGA